LEAQVVEVVEAAPVARSGDESVEQGGYQQELKRTLGSFQVFAISFAFISVAVGIFGTYDDVLQNAGPVGIWLWVIVAIGQLLVALVIAQFAARISLSGSSYQWASRAGQPENRLGVRLAHVLLPRTRSRCRRFRALQPGFHAALRHRT
jgi:amino acid permease